MKKKQINQLIKIARTELVENLIYEHNFTSKQQKIMFEFFNKVLEDLRKELISLI